MTLAKLMRDISKFIKHNGLVMSDVQKSAKAAQRRIEAAGFKWDAKRELWRHPNGERTERTQ